MNKKFSLIAIDGNLAYSKDAVWAYYRLTGQPFDFVGYENQEANAQDFNNTMASLISNQTTSVEAMIILTSTRFNVDSWAKQWYEKAVSWNPPQGYDNYVQEIKNYLKRVDFANTTSYFAVKLGNRSAIGTSDVLGMVKGAVDGFSDFLSGSKDHSISDKERRNWRAQAEFYTRNIANSRLNGVPVEPHEIAFLLKKPLYPAMPEPHIREEDVEDWLNGELYDLGESYIEKGRKFLKIKQYDEQGTPMEGYVSTLCFTKFPDTMHYPENMPWIYSLVSLGIPFTFFSRFTIEPAGKIRKQVERKRAELDDEANNAMKGGVLPIGMQERMESTESLEFELSKTNEPWVFAHHRLQVAAGTEKELHEYIAILRNHYDSLKVKFVQPTGDQFKLFLESQPADKVRVGSFLQRQTLSVISGGAPNATVHVGDKVLKGKGWVGPYLGYTTGSALTPFFFSPHVPVAQNKPGGTVILGSPGGGKTFLAFTLASLMTIQGVKCIYVDPKADALLLNDLTEIGNVEIIDLADGNDGILDPFSLTSADSDQLILALETIRQLLGNLDKEEDNALSEVMNEVMSNTRISRSLYTVMDMLLQSKNPSARHIGNRLQMVSQMPLARLCFAPRGEKDIVAKANMTVFTLLGLEMPAPDTPSTDHTYAERLSVAVMSLLTSFTREVALRKTDDSHPRAVLIDEAWMVTATSSGQRLISALARMGRALNTTVTLITQNATDFQQEGLLNSMSTIFAFNSKSPDEARAVLKVFQLPDTPENIRTFTSLENGQCVVKSADDSISLVKIDGWNIRWNRAFETNPEAKRLQLLGRTE